VGPRTVGDRNRPIGRWVTCGGGGLLGSDFFWLFFYRLQERAGLIATVAGVVEFFF
jgi:hypothetical protein